MHLPEIPKLSDRCLVFPISNANIAYRLIISKSGAAKYTRNPIGRPKLELSYW